jgi:AhpD family alkylhydroperoxidase
MTTPRITFEELPDGLYPLMKNIEVYLKQTIPHPMIGLIKMRASQINGCGFCLDMHHKDAVAAGESVQRLYLLPAWKESPVYTDAEKAVLNLTDTLTKISQKDADEVAEAYEIVEKYFSKQEIANFVLAICQINSWNRIAITFGTIPGSYRIPQEIKKGA